MARGLQDHCHSCSCPCLSTPRPGARTGHRPGPGSFDSLFLTWALAALAVSTPLNYHPAVKFFVWDLLPSVYFEPPLGDLPHSPQALFLWCGSPAPGSDLKALVPRPWHRRVAGWLGPKEHPGDVPQGNFGQSPSLTSLLCRICHQAGFRFPGAEARRQGNLHLKASDNSFISPESGVLRQRTQGPMALFADSYLTSLDASPKTHELSTCDPRSG